MSDLNLFQLNKKIKEIINENLVDIVHLRGLMSKSLLKIYLALIFNKIPFVTTLYSQLNSYNLNNKLFFEDPDVKSLQTSEKSMQNPARSWLSPLLKKIYLVFIGKTILNIASAIIVFSKFEKEEVEKIKKFNKIHIIHEALLNEKELEKELKYQSNHDFYTANGYKDNINIAYWGRIDFTLKGIDRIIKALAKTNNKDIIIHILGPNYNNGIIQVESLIKTLKLNNQVIIHSESEWKGNKAPFISSDYSILCSRWDGFPRTLRESIALNTPIIVSTETNFSDLCLETNCGIEFQDIDNLVGIFNKLQKPENNYIKGCYRAKNIISVNNVASNLMEVYTNAIQYKDTF